MASNAKIMTSAITKPRYSVQRLQLLLLFAPHRIRQPWVLGTEFWKDAVFQDAVGFGFGDEKGVHIGRDRHDTLAVPASDGGGRCARTQRSHPAQRHRDPARSTQKIVLNVGYRVAFMLRQPNVHPYLLRASLHPQGLGTEERSSRLPRHVVERETEGPRFGPQFQTDLGHAWGVIRADVVDAPDSPKSFDQRGCDRSETLRFGMRQYVEGRIEYSQTQTPQGETRYWTDIIVRDMIMLGSGGRSPEMGDAGGRAQRPAADAAGRGMQAPDDDLPF